MRGILVKAFTEDKHKSRSVNGDNPIKWIDCQKDLDLNSAARR
jgi:hypothetical protein